VLCGYVPFLFAIQFHFKTTIRIQNTRNFSNAKQQHALSITLFSQYLLLDVLLSSLPRLLLLSLLSPLSSTFCSPSTSPTYSTPLFFSTQTPTHSEFQALEPFENREGWTEESCYRVVGLAQLAAMAGVVAGSVLQGFGGLWVREYARGLVRREMVDEEVRQRERDVVIVGYVDSLEEVQRKC
jgi:hypothetical protein